MGQWWRRIRAALGMGLIWGAAWFAAGVLLARVPGFYSDVPFAILFAPIGFVSGIIFSGILVVAGSRRAFSRLSLLRFGAWGALSGVVLSGFAGGIAALCGETLGSGFLVFGLAVSTASAACAAGSLALARRAERRELADGAPGEAELAGDAKRMLPGRGD